ncbi:hypothetical protein E1A91_D01G268000v1 [Gossypium mustelinum]|uniref:Uncharacterized protein n=1 Tax=Gossypium mustelinum TaxID=34275 RepID=A0A5D2WE49_GOSMU|nr:hypothetical protein E1A91_D01G268000v1 [Gossypium mustelinum]
MLRRMSFYALSSKPLFKAKLSANKEREKKRVICPFAELDYNDGEITPTRAQRDSGYGRCWWWGCQTVWDCCSEDSREHFILVYKPPLEREG